MNKDPVYLFNNLAKLDEIPDQIRELNRLIRTNALGSYSARSWLQDSSMGLENISAFSAAGEDAYLKLCRITNPYFCWASPVLTAEDVLSGLVKITEGGTDGFPDHLNAFDRTYWETFFNVQRDFFELAPLVFGVTPEVNELLSRYCDRLWKLFELIGTRHCCTYQLRLIHVEELLRLQEKEPLDTVRLNALSALDLRGFL